MSINYDILPEHLRDGARRYIEQGIDPYGFLRRVILNDVEGAYDACFDGDGNMEALGRVVCFWCTEAPADCWGSRPLMQRWMAARVAERNAKGDG